jgi:predicted phosphodiesterase
MRTAVISDIHGHLRPLLAVLDDSQSKAADRIVCLGDSIDGGEDDLGVVRELMRRDVAVIRGNHDEFFRFQAGSPEAAYMQSLVSSVSEGDVVYTHISPRSGDRKIGDRFEAWNVFDETPQRIAFVGHVHIPLIFRNSAAAGQAGVLRIEYGQDIKLDRARRYVVCPGSVCPGRDGIAAARYALYDDAKQAVEFRMVERV